MTVLPILSDGDVYRVRDGQHTMHLRTQDNGAVPLLPGWKPASVLVKSADVAVVGLRHDNGLTALWYFDNQYRFLTNTLSQLPAPVQSELVANMRDAALIAWRKFVLLDSTVADADIELVADFLPPLVRELGEDKVQDGLIAQHVVLLANDADLPTIDTCGSGNAARPVSLPFVRGLFSRQFLLDLGHAVSNDQLTLPSPIDGMLVSTTVALVVTPNTLAYRLHDTHNDVVYFLFAAHWRSAIDGIYFPRSGLLICEGLRNQHDLFGMLGVPPALALFRHTVNHAAALNTYAKDSARSMAMVYIQTHLGHHLYNELGGLDHIVNSVPAERLPRILLINADNAEMYGPLDAIYPEITGKIDRTPRDADALAKYAYANRLCLVRPTDDYVTRGLAKRIIRHLDADPEVALHRSYYEDLRSKDYEVFMLGLRVENRTLADPVGFFCDTIDTLRDKCGKVAIVVDGHDAMSGPQGSRMYESHGESAAVRSVLDAENEILTAIRLRYQDDENVDIISTIGATMAVTVFWCVRSSMFVTPWGAGLAKYRWLCNRPGLVVGGHRFLGQGEYLNTHLYDAREFMGAPSRVVFFSAADVEDDPSAPLLIGLNDPHRVNYRVRPGATRARVLQALAALQPPLALR